MNSKQIDSILCALISPSDSRFLGVFPRDLLPDRSKIISFPSCLVFNADDSNAPGSHWLALYYPNSSSTEFFDSYALPPSLYNIPSSALTPISKLEQNQNQIQSENSNVCGQYCIYYLSYRALGFPLPLITSNFSCCAFEFNDNLVATYVHSFSRSPIPLHIPKSHPSPCCPRQSCLLKKQMMCNLKN